MLRKATVPARVGTRAQTSLARTAVVTVHRAERTFASPGSPKKVDVRVFSVFLGTNNSYDAF